MAFTREEVLAYESQAPAVETPPAAVAQDKSTPAADAGSEAAPSAADDTAQPVAGDDSSGAPADSPPADGDSDTDTTAVVKTEPEDNEPAPKPGSARERIQDLVAENKSLRKFGEHVLGELKKVREVPASETSAAPAAPVSDADDPAPTLEGHEFDQVKFAKAQNEWLQKQVDKRLARALQESEGRQTAAAAQRAFEARAAEFAKGKDDYDVVMSNVDLPKVAQGTARAIVFSEHGPALAYHLAKNPDVATRISRMNPEQQLMALGRIEVQLAAPAPKSETKPDPKTAPKKVTKAPPPPVPNPAGTTTAVRNLTDNSLSMDEWVKADRAQKAAEREARIKMRDRMRR